MVIYIIQHQMFGGRKHDRFAKVIHELNKSADKNQLPKDSHRVSSDVSVLGRSSIHTSQRSTKYTHNTHNPQKPQSTQQQTIEALLDDYQVLVNRNRTTLRASFIPTCKGLKYVLVYNEDSYVNLSWMHSVQQLEKNKLLLLYYGMEKMKAKEKPQIESLVVEFSHRSQLLRVFSAILYVHNNHHDEDVEKVYNKLCSN